MGDPKDLPPAAERLFQSYQAASGYGNVPNNISVAQQQAAAALQSAQLAAAAAAAYAGPMLQYNPYAAMCVFGGAANPFAPAGFGAWPGLIPAEYMLAVQHNMQVPTTESFADILGKIQPPRSSGETVQTEDGLGGDVSELEGTKECSGENISSPTLSSASVNTGFPSGISAVSKCHLPESASVPAITTGQIGSGSCKRGAENSHQKTELSNLQTLAAVATSLSTTDRDGGTNSCEGDFRNGSPQERIHSETEPNRAASTSTSASRGRSPLEPGEIVALSSKKRHAGKISLESELEQPKVKRKKASGSNQDESSESGEMSSEKDFSEAEKDGRSNKKAESLSPRLDPKLLNASAVAWAALSNQIFLGMQMGLQKDLLLKHLSAASGSTSSISPSSSRTIDSDQRNKLSGRGRPATISAADEQKVPNDQINSHLDAVIESVVRSVRQQCCSSNSKTERRERVKQNIGRKRRSGPYERGSSKNLPGNNITVRQQLAMKRAQECEYLAKNSATDSTLASPENASPRVTAESDFSVPLDLSTKHSVPDVRGVKSEDRSTDSPTYPKKRKVAEEHLVRIPLEMGWRRQTCIRSITANGVRGDVIYYAPCGKRLGSYAEVTRYLAKKEIGGLSRRNFSFSCKVLAGEFLQIKPDSSKNGIVKLDENDVIKIIQNMTAQNVASANGRTSSCRPRNFGKQEQSVRRMSRNRAAGSFGRRQYSGSDVLAQQKLLKVIESRRAEKDKESQIRAQRILDAMRRSKENEIKKHHFAMLQKQVKQEREKVRQQALAAKALETRKRQEEKQRIVAERLIRQEEKIVLPTIERVPGMNLCGRAFADVLMVAEFLKNFGHVLRIDTKDIPSIKDLQAGLLNSPDHLKFVRKLTKILLTLVLEYPGLPAGPQGKTFIGQLVRELKITYDNMSELLRMFLNSRDAEGQKLGSFLKEKCFESLTAADKAAILAYMCNELLYCRNVVREIEGNIEEIARLKGDRWIREGKIRLLRTMQAKKRVDQQRKNGQQPSFTSCAGPEKLLNSSENLFVEDGCENSSLSATEVSTLRAGSPNSLSASESDTEMKSLAEMRNEALKKEDWDKKESIQEAENPSCIAGTPVKKPQPPGSSQLETVSEEEKKMSVKQLEKRIDELAKETEDLRDTIEETSGKVRVQPYGEDRYHRLCWVVPSVGGILMESIESGHINNPACNLCPVGPCSYSHVDTDVKECISELVNKVSVNENEEAVLDLTILKEKRKTEDIHQHLPAFRTRDPTIPLQYRTGWWLVQSKDELEQLTKNLQLRGIRERLLQRTLSRYCDYITRRSFDGKRASLVTAEELKYLGSSEVVNLSLKRLLSALRLLEEKVFHANIHFRQWKPPEYSVVDGGSSTVENATEPGNDIEDEESSKSSLTSEISSSGEETVNLTTIKERLLKLEQNVERRYLLSPFHFCRSLVPESVLNSASGQSPSSPTVVTTGHRVSENSDANLLQEDDGNSNLSDGNRDALGGEEITAQLIRWRVGVENATNPAQLMLCLLQLDANVAWEKSIMRASCQICHGGDNESKLLLCDGCDMGYHTYCFKPEMGEVPSGDWFCPDCISKATEKPCCLVCCKQDRTFIHCTECDHSFHAECLNLPSLQSEQQACSNLKKLPRCASTSSVTSSSSSWKCPGCSESRSNPGNRADVHGADCLPSSSESAVLIARDLGGEYKQTAIRKKSWGSGKKGKLTKQARDSPRHSKEATPVSNTLSMEELCSVMLAELDAHKDCWPFKLPVDVKAFPLYKKVIKKPMDLSYIKAKLNSHKYESEEEFSEDVNLIFANCNTFNEDNSPVGKAGHALKRFFSKRWKELREDNGRSCQKKK